jgi:hypothetical protein
MRRRLLLLNLLLLALGAAAAWQVRVRYLAGQAEERRLLRPPAKITQTIPVSPLPAPAPAQAANYSDVAQKMLFTQDRNPDVVVQAAPPKPVPAFPVAYGMMDLGDGPMILLSEKPGAPNRGYAAGEKVGAFVIAGLEADAVIFAWDDKQFRKTLEELRPPGAAAQAAASAGPVQTAPSTQAVSAAVGSGPGEPTNGNQRACVPGDNSPDGTVRDGWKKVVKRYPFTITCHWEPVK